MADIQGESIEAVAYLLYSDCRALNGGAYASAEALLALYAECAAMVGASVPDSARPGHSIGSVAYKLYTDCKALNVSAYQTSDSLLELYAGCAAIVGAGSAPTIHEPEMAEPAAA
jgi:hypothetical protein